MPVRRFVLPFLIAIAALIAPAGASADRLDLGGFHLSSVALTTHENVGAAVITVSRTDTLFPAQVRYGDSHLTAIPGTDYTPTGGRLDFAAGQSTATFSIPIVDHGTPGPPKLLSVYLYGASPIGLGVPSTAVLTILNDDAVSITKILENPLGLPLASIASDPLTGIHFFVDRSGNPASVYTQSHPSMAGALRAITSQPMVYRFGAWNGSNPSVAVSNYLEKATSDQPGSIPMISTYRLVHGRCGGYSDSPAQVASYQHWMNGFAQGISTHQAVVFLEMDSLITTGCLSGHGLKVRMAELQYAITVLSYLPRVVVYLDAGAADALPASRAAHLLKLAGVSRIQGFFLNSTHFDWTSNEIRYGDRISRMTGGKHFVVNTAVNGQGPLVPADRVHHGNEVLCNPAGRGLGPKPTWHTGYKNVDAFAWIGNPGRSGGACVPGAPSTGVFWPAYALMLVRNANYAVR